jgi:hypothetical protein
MNLVTARALAAITIGLFCATSEVAATPIENGGFEAGNFSSWTVLSRPAPDGGPYSGAYAAVIPSVDGFEPLEGQYSALLVAKSTGFLTTCDADPWHVNCPSPVNFPSASLGGPTLANSFNASSVGYVGGVIGQDFYADSGDVLSWNWRFLGENVDTIFALITDGETRLGLNLHGDGSGWSYYDRETESSVDFRYIEQRQPDGSGWPSSESFAIPHEGLWTAYFGVGQQADTFVGSGLLLDSVSVHRVAPPVPEPETYAMWGLGLILILSSRRRRCGNERGQSFAGVGNLILRR